MLKSWEADDQTTAKPDTEREHYTYKGVMRRLRKLQAQGKRGVGEVSEGGKDGYFVFSPESSWPPFQISH